MTTPASPNGVLKETLRAVARRMRLRVFSQRLTWCLMAGLIPAALHVALAKTGLLFRLGWDAWPEWVALVPVALAAIVGVAWGLAYRVSDFEAAHAADLALGLQERLGSAVAFCNAPPDSRAILRAILLDASAHCATVQPRAVVARVLPRRTLWVSMLGCAVAGLWFAPPQNWFVTPSELAERQEIREQGKRLLELAREVRTSADSADLERTQRIAREIEAVGKSLSRGSLSKREAMKALAELTDELKQAHQQLAEQAAAKQLRAGVQKARERGVETPEMSGMLRALGAGDIAQAQGELSKLRQQIAAGNLSAADKERLAKDLQAIGESLEGTSAEEAAQAMKSAARALQEDDLGAAAEQLGAAEEKLPEGEGQEQLSEMQQLQDLAREVEFAEEQVANPGRLGSEPGEKTPREETGTESTSSEGPSREEQAMQRRGDRLSAVSRDVQRQAQESGSKRAEDLAKKTQRLGERMSSGQVDRNQAAEEMGKLQEQARQAREEALQRNGAGQVEKALEKTRTDGLQTEMAARMAEQLAQGNPEQAGQQLQRMAEQLSNLSPEQQKALAEDLKSMAQNLDGTRAEQLAEAMAKAAQSMDQQQAEKAAQALQQTAEQLAQQKWVQDLAESGQLEQLLEQMGGGEGEGAGGSSSMGDGEDDPGSPDGGAGLAESEAGLLGVPGRNTRVRGQTDNVQESPSIDVKGLGPMTSAGTPYYDVRVPSTREVQEALDRDQIPAAQRPLVEDYFRPGR